MNSHFFVSPQVRQIVIVGILLLACGAFATVPFDGVQSGQSTTALRPTSQSIQSIQTAPSRPKTFAREVSYGVRNYELIELTNNLGEYEVRVLLKEERWGLPDTQRTILIGREIISQFTPNSRRVSHWFVPLDYESQTPIEMYQRDDDPWPTAREIIRQHVETNNRWLAWIMFETLTSSLSLTVGHKNDVLTQIQQEQLTLLDLEIRTNHLAKQNPHDPFLPAARSLIADGWIAMVARLHDEGTRKIWLYALGDVALVAAAGKVAQVAERVIGSATSQMAVTRVGQALQNSYQKIVQVTKGRAARAAALSKRSHHMMTEAAARAVIVKASLQAQISFAIHYLQQRSILARAVTTGLRSVVTTAGYGLGEIRYLAISQIIQVAMEAAVRPEDLFDWNPIIMGKKMMNDQEFRQNVAYMANESFWMAGVASLPKSSFGKRFVVCGAIGLVDSVAMSWLVKGEPDPKRIALDTTWEVLVGNAQTLFDITVLQYFGSLAIKNNNPKLKLVGYLITMVDQATGYYGYAKVTSLLRANGSDLTTTAAAPISSGTDGADIFPDGVLANPTQPPLLPMAPKDPIAPPKLRLIPILAP